MKTPDEIYSPRFFRQHVSLAWRAPIVCQAIYNWYCPQTMIDVGCGAGDLVKQFQDMGVDSWGIDGASNAVPYLMFSADRFIQHDLRKPLELGRKFDLVISLEVAEHIEPEYADVFTKNLAALADEFILISAAPPGQGGLSHVNCQPNEYWISKMSELEFEFDPISVRIIKREWRPWGEKKGIRAYYYNLLAFRRPTCEGI